MQQDSSAQTSFPGEQKLHEIMQYVQVGRCVNGVSHDVNNCLGAILAYAELAELDRSTSPEVARMVHKIIEAVERASTLVTELTNVARPLKPNASILDLRELVRGITVLRDYEFRINQVTLRLDLPEAIPSLSGDPAQMRLALLYLLLNAEEAAVQTKPAVVTVTLRVLPEGLEIAFCNSGEGIGEQERRRLFQPFHSTKPGPHLGLGLSHAKRIIEAHGGTLSYEAEGFVVRLPFGHGHQDALTPAETGMFR